MNVIYHPSYNINLGLLNYLHPFDGRKFKAIHKGLSENNLVTFIAPEKSMDMSKIDEFLSTLMRKKVRDTVFVFRALEVPKIPFVSFSLLDRRILSPMRWGVAGTMLGATEALKHKGVYWNLAGGYHHAMQQNMEGFCIYNDIGICHQQLVKSGKLSKEDKILIIDVDAHHGNGNAYTFMENDKVTILDVYNAGIYPMSGYSRDRVDIAVPLQPGTEGDVYLSRYAQALSQLDDDYRLAFVVAGTDVLLSDKLGRLCLSVEDVAKREKMTIDALKQRSIPVVMLGGGGYSKESAQAVIAAISACAE